VDEEEEADGPADGPVDEAPGLESEALVSDYSTGSMRYWTCSLLVVKESLDDVNRKKIIKLSGCFAVVVPALVRPATCAFRRTESGIPPLE
jgi:hypothetical protein